MLSGDEFHDDDVTSDPATIRDAFDDHLDECEQCRDQPFKLCPTGARILASVEGAS